mgnify:CR=1 FL=1|tara:strand:+ start:286 stop:1386 length:1101 start_codon:yes stop_codon:yes gene_type:complete
MEYQKVEIGPGQLLLDPNNYRFHDIKGYKEVKLKARYKEAGVQTRALSLLQETTAFDLDALRDSIRTNGFIPIEQIVVTPYDEDEGESKYLVIEGNRRSAVLTTLLADADAGAVDLADGIRQSLETITVVVLIGTEEEIQAYQRTLMGIRHVAGIREWGPYQQAKLVVEMFEEGGATLSSVAQKIGISSREVARRYRASKALRQMEEDEEFSEHAEPRLYAFFHEAVSQPKVRDWLGFNDENYKAENADARRLFFEILSPREVDGEKRAPKLTSANPQVRQLKDIVTKSHPLEILADPDKTFDDALQAAHADVVEDDEGVVERSLATTIGALKKPGLAYMEANERAKELWEEVLENIEKIKKIFPK